MNEQDFDEKFDDIQCLLNEQRDRNRRFELLINKLKKQQKYQMLWLVVLLTIQVCLFMFLLTL